MSSNGNTSWSHKLFVNYPHLYEPILEEMKKQAESDVNGLCQIFKRFNIAKHAKILDLSCGIGRHSLLLARKGYEIVGYDPSEYFIEKARLQIKKDRDNMKYKPRFYVDEAMDVAKVLNTKNERDFNGIICMFQSIGYNEKDQDLHLFRDAHELSLNKGILVIETENRDWRIKNFYPYYNYEYEKIIVQESWNLNLENSIVRSVSKFYNRINKNEIHLELELQTALRLYSLHELIEMASSQGWTYKASFGNLNTLGPVGLDSENIIIVFQKI